MCLLTYGRDEKIQSSRSRFKPGFISYQVETLVEAKWNPPFPMHVMDTDGGSVPATAGGLDLLHCVRNKRTASGVLSHVRQVRT